MAPTFRSVPTIHLTFSQGMYSDKQDVIFDSLVCEGYVSYTIGNQHTLYCHIVVSQRVIEMAIGMEEDFLSQLRRDVS